MILSSCLVRPLQTHLLHPVHQGRWFDPQQLRRAVGALDFPMGFLKDDHQVVAFTPLQFDFRKEFRLDPALFPRQRNLAPQLLSTIQDFFSDESPAETKNKSP